MHEIAHTDYFIAWTHPKVVYHRACERGNRIRAVVGWGRDLRRRHNASSRSTSTYRDRETARGWDEKEDSLLFYFSPSHCSLSNPWLRLILLWCDVNLGRQRDIDRQRERGRYGFMQLHTAEAQCGHNQSSHRQTDWQRGAMILWSDWSAGRQTGQWADHMEVTVSLGWICLTQVSNYTSIFRERSVGNFLDGVSLWPD